jgi:hypothetical protein
MNYEYSSTPGGFASRSTTMRESNQRSNYPQYPTAKPSAPPAFLLAPSTGQMEAAASGTKYLDRIQRLLGDVEAEKHLGNFSTVAKKFHDAATTMMDMVEEQRWPPGEERRQAITTARRYIQVGRSYDMQVRKWDGQVSRHTYDMARDGVASPEDTYTSAEYEIHDRAAVVLPEVYTIPEDEVSTYEFPIGWVHPKMTNQAAEAMLEKTADGSFIVRDCKKEHGYVIISVKNEGHVTHHTYDVKEGLIDGNINVKTTGLRDVISQLSTPWGDWYTPLVQFVPAADAPISTDFTEVDRLEKDSHRQSKKIQSLKAQIKRLSGVSFRAHYHSSGDDADFDTAALREAMTELRTYDLGRAGVISPEDTYATVECEKDDIRASDARNSRDLSEIDRLVDVIGKQRSTNQSQSEMIASLQAQVNRLSSLSFPERNLSTSSDSEAAALRDAIAELRRQAQLEVKAVHAEADARAANHQADFVKVQEDLQRLRQLLDITAQQAAAGPAADVPEPDVAFETAASVHPVQPSPGVTPLQIDKIKALKKKGNETRQCTAPTIGIASEQKRTKKKAVLLPEPVAAISGVEMIRLQIAKIKASKEKRLRDLSPSTNSWNTTNCVPPLRITGSTSASCTLAPPNTPAGGHIEVRPNLQQLLKELQDKHFQTHLARKKNDWCKENPGVDPATSSKWDTAKVVFIADYFRQYGTIRTGKQTFDASRPISSLTVLPVVPRGPRKQPPTRTSILAVNNQTQSPSNRAKLVEDGGALARAPSRWGKNEVCAWLEINSLKLDVSDSEGISGKVLMQLDDDDFVAMGVNSKLERERITTAIGKLVASDGPDGTGINGADENDDDQVFLPTCTPASGPLSVAKNMTIQTKTVSLAAMPARNSASGGTVAAPATKTTRSASTPTAHYGRSITGIPYAVTCGVGTVVSQVATTKLR